MSLAAFFRRPLGLALTGLLTGCGAPDQPDLPAWLAGQRSGVAKPVLAPSAAVAPTSRAYAHPEGVEPFSPQRLPRPALVQASASAGPGAQPGEKGTDKLTLETAPLDAMTLVGTVIGEGLPLAVLRMNGRLYPVRLGDRLGPDQGRITAISPAGLVLREVVMNNKAQASERFVRLNLVQESP
jgi:type IV pilus assembly protein PilP